ncbi:MAG: hypothetical protein RL391_265 [Actinomycetota bacterium]
MNESLPTGIGLDAIQPSQQRIGIEVGLDDDHHVQIRPLIIGATDRVGLEHLRLSDDRLPQSCGRELEVRDSISEIATQGHDGAM